MLERIKQLMEQKELTASQFADAMEVPRAVVSHVLSGRNKPSLDVVLKIASTYDDVNLEWLLLGKGKMLNTLVVNTPEYPAVKAAGIPVQSENMAPVEGGESNKIMQEHVRDSTVVSAAQEAGRSIRQVMMFYSDGTFETYKPS